MTTVNRDRCINAWYNLTAPRNRERFILCDEWKVGNLNAFRTWWSEQIYAGRDKFGVTILLSGRDPKKLAGPESLVVASRRLVKWLSTNVLFDTYSELPLGVVKCGAGYRPRYGSHGEVFTGHVVSTKEEAHRLWQVEKIAQFNEFIAEHSDDSRIVALLEERKTAIQFEYDNNLQTQRV